LRTPYCSGVAVAVLGEALWLVRAAGGWLIRRRARRGQPV
jgi:hypothetical protein